MTAAAWLLAVGGVLVLLGAPGLNRCLTSIGV
jgi:hypothetical protein